MKDLCSECGGVCCKRMGGCYSPSDFSDLSVLKDEIKKGHISIDWWEGDVTGGPLEHTYYLRARNRGANIIDPSWGGMCCLLTDDGCSLPWDKRPRQCRELVPLREECIDSYTKEDACKDWYKHQDMLVPLLEEFQ